MGFSFFGFGKKKEVAAPAPAAAMPEEASMAPEAVAPTEVGQA